MSIWDYKISFPYGATTAPYSPSHPHKGEDRAAPLGTPIPVNGKVIGWVGSTGKSSGSHLHVQKVTSAVVSPNGGGKTLPQPAKVTATGYNSEIGNYVRIKDANGTVWSYFHQTKVNVKLGDNIGEDMLTKNQVRDLFVFIYGRGPSETEYAKYVGKTTYEKLRANMLASAKFAGLLTLASAGKLNAKNHLITPLKRAYVPPPTPGLTVLPPGEYQVN